MLSTSPQNTKYVVLGEKPNLADDSYNTYDNALVSNLISQISTLSSIYHKTPEDILAQQKGGAAKPVPSSSAQKKEEEEKGEEEIPSPAAVEEKKSSKKKKKDSSDEDSD
jgi:AP-1 complex subunit beta-1